MSKFETIGQFVSMLETDFKPDDMIDFNVETFKYINVEVDDKMIALNSVTPKWVTKDKTWNFLAVERNPTKVSKIISELKNFLPDHRNDLIVMTGDNGYYGTLARLETFTKIYIDSPKSNCYVMKHSKIIEHNNKILVKQALDKFIKKVEAFSREGNNLRKVFKFAKYLYQTLLIKQKLANPKVDLPVPYLYDGKFYKNFEDVKVRHDQITFSLFKGIMVSILDLSNVKKHKTTFVSREPTLTKFEPVKTYMIESESFSMDGLLTKFNLTETQLQKFFTEKDGKFLCLHPEILKSFEK